MNRVGIIIVTFNRLNLLKEVIGSIRQQTFKDFQIIVVNNGSTDGTAEWLAEEKDIISINQSNVGGAGGFFSGLKYVAENGYENCWLMDDDVICHPTALEELVIAHNKKENIGFVCSKVLGIDGCPMNTPDIDDRPTKNGYACYSDLVEFGMIKVKKATFVSVFLSTKIIPELGLPYKEYFIWGDDSEYTERISQKYDSYMACKSVVIHKRSVQGALTFKTETEKKRLKNYFFMMRNQAYNQFKYDFRTIEDKVFFWIDRIAKLGYYILTGKFYKFWIMLKATLALISFKPQIKYPNQK